MILSQQGSRGEWFDVELVYLANRLGVPIKEVQVRRPYAALRWY